MRKSFKHILLAGLTIASTAMAMNAQTAGLEGDRGSA